MRKPSKRVPKPRNPQEEPEPVYGRARLYAAGSVHGPSKDRREHARGVPVGWVEADGTITRED